MAERGSTVNRIRNAGMTKRDIANGKLPASWLSASERALRANPGARALSAKVAERMIANPEAVASKLAAVRMGAIDAARVKNYKTAALVAAGTALVAGVAALTSKSAKADDGKGAKPAAPPAKAPAINPETGRPTSRREELATSAVIGGAGVALMRSAMFGSPRFGAAKFVGGTLLTMTGAGGLLVSNAKADDGKGAKPAAPPAKAAPGVDPTAPKPIDKGAVLATGVGGGAGALAATAFDASRRLSMSNGRFGLLLTAATAGGAVVGAFLNSAAKAAAERTPGTPSGNAPSAPAAQTGPASRSTYVTVDGKTVEGTEAEIRNWQNRRAK